MQEVDDQWGAEVLRFEVTVMFPSDRQVARALHKQAVAQREKIQTELLAEGKRIQVEIMSDAQKYKTEKEAEAYLYKNTKEGEGDKEKTMRLAEAERQSIEMINESLTSKTGEEVVKMRMTNEFLSKFGQFAKGSNQIVMTSDVCDINKFVSTAEDIFK